MTRIDFEAGVWLNPAPEWAVRGGQLIAKSGENTDFWRETHYGFTHDNGHALLFDVPRDFTATITFEGTYRHNYDQAGLLLRGDAENWIKMGIEFVSGIPSFAVVATCGASDWSVFREPDIIGPQTIRISRVGGAVIVH